MAILYSSYGQTIDRTIMNSVSSIKYLENLRTNTTGISEGVTDMAKRLKTRVEIGDQTVWVTGETQRDLFNAYLQHAIDAGIVAPVNAQQAEKQERKELFEDRAMRWFNLYKVGKVRETTLAGYESYLKKHIIPYFGQRDIREITIDDVQEFLNTKASYARKTINEMLLTLSMILEAAKEDGLIPMNPAKSKRLKNPSRKEDTREPLTTAQALDVEAHLKDIPKLIDRRYVAMLLKFPARCEDIRGLKIKDFDFDRGIVSIKRSVTYAKAQTIIDLPKTKAGVREMLILPGLLEVLALTDEEKNDPEAFILHMGNDLHKPLSFQANRRLWERVEAAINVYGKTPHCFRHTFATIAHRKGVDDKTLQTMGGWADQATMKNVYIHTQEEDYEKARSILTAIQ